MKTFGPGGFPAIISPVSMYKAPYALRKQFHDYFLSLNPAPEHHMAAICGYFNKGSMQILEHKMQIINSES